MLREFDEVVPGSADRVLRAWEAQSTHRQQMERRVINGNVAAQTRGAWLGFFICLAVLALAAYALYLGHGGVATLIVGIDIVGLAGVFVYGRTQQVRERREKAGLMTGRR